MLVHAEPWDQYGGNSGFVQGLGYTDVNVSGWSNPGRTGSYAVNLSNSLIRRALDNPATRLGQGVAYKPTSVSGESWQTAPLRFESAGKVMECTVSIGLDNSLIVWDRTGVVRGRTPANSLIMNSFQWIEAQCDMNAGGVVGTGIVEVRVNGVSKLIVNGINLPNQFAYHLIGGSQNAFGVYDDWIAWDGTGTQNNDFMGDRRLFVSYLNANLATQNFTPSAGSAFDCVNNSPPNDTIYIDGAAAGNISEFSGDAIGIAANDVAAVVLMARLFKTDAGTATGLLGINSNGFVQNSPEIFPGTTGAFYKYPVELDPNGNIPWVRAAVDNAARRITRNQ